MPTTDNSAPARQAYEATKEAGYKGRFASTLANIRLFKSNPYIANMSESDLAEANKKLLKPYHGEQFTDDDGYVYTCAEVKDPVTGSIQYVYTSKSKENFEKLKYYESKGVLNQLMSAYNNGQVYKFYVDRANLMIYPNNSLVFPEEYEYYTVRSQELNRNNEFIYVAGVTSSTNPAENDVNIAMKKIIDNATGNNYRRMSAAKIFAANNNNDPDRIYDAMINGNFYVVDFFDKDDNLIDTKLFQAADAGLVNSELPSQSVVDLKVSVLRSGVPESSSNDVYPILAGEDLTSLISFSVSAVYDDGTVKVITDLLGTANLSRENYEVNTMNANVGEQFPVKFTYYPNVDNDGNPISTGITKTVVFQVVSNTSEKLYRVIPVVWTDSKSSLNVSGSPVKSYKMKIYTLSADGVLENKTRAAYNSLKVVNDGNVVDYTGQYIYDTYNQVIQFVYNMNDNAKTVTFDIALYNDNAPTHYRFKTIFGDEERDINGKFIEKYTNAADEAAYGYGETQALYTLGETYGHETVNGVVVSNTINLLNTTFTFDSYTGKTFKDRYSRRIASSGKVLTPNSVQFYSVKDESLTPLNTRTEGQIRGNTTSMSITAINEMSVAEILGNLKTTDPILAKYYYVDGSEVTLVNFDIYSLVKK